MKLRASTLYILLLIAALYVVRFERTRDLEGFSTELTQLLDDSGQAAGATHASRSERLRKMIFLVYRAEKKNVDIEELVDEALAQLDMPASYAPALTNALVRNVRFGQRHGLFDEKNIARIRRGESPAIQSGGFRGDLASFDNVIPHHLAPEISNNFANFVWKPKSIIEAGTDRPDISSAVQAATDLHSCSHLSGYSLRRVISSLRSI